MMVGTGAGSLHRTLAVQTPWPITRPSSPHHHHHPALRPWHEPREPPPAQALHARQQRPRGLLTGRGRRGLPLVGITRLTREEVLERFEQRGRLVVGDTLGEIEVIDSMAESVE